MLNAVKKKRILTLDYMRALACITVVLYHYTTRYQEIFGLNMDWSFIIPNGAWAVSIFFLLSGYLSVYQCREKDTLFSYSIRRASRLYPTYWVCILLTFVVTTLFLKSRAVSVPTALINLTMLQSFVGVPSVDGAYWTLANELVFYAFLGIAVVVFKQKKNLPWFALGWLGVLFVLLTINSSSRIYLAVCKVFAAEYGHMFITGCLIYYLLEDRNGLRKTISVLGLLLCLLYQYVVFGLSYFLFFLCMAVLLVLLLFIHKRDITVPEGLQKYLRPLEYIAAISYPLYLIHQNIGYAILQKIQAQGMSGEWIVFVPAGVSIVVAYVLHRFVEIPVAKSLGKAISAKSFTTK